MSSTAATAGLAPTPASTAIRPTPGASRLRFKALVAAGVLAALVAAWFATGLLGRGHHVPPPRPSCGTTAARAPFARAPTFRRARRWSARSSIDNGFALARVAAGGSLRGDGADRPRHARSCCRRWRSSRIARHLPAAESNYVDAVAATLGRDFKTAIAKYTRDRECGGRRRTRLRPTSTSAAPTRRTRMLDRAHRGLREGDAAGPAVRRRLPALRHPLRPAPAAAGGERGLLEGGGHLPGDVEPGRPGRGAVPARLAAGQDPETARSQGAARTIAGDVTRRPPASTRRSGPRCN